LDDNKRIIKKDVEEGAEGNSASAYMLFYAREGAKVHY
jgi:hypothetical protein